MALFVSFWDNMCHVAKKFKALYSWHCLSHFGTTCVMWPFFCFSIFVASLTCMCDSGIYQVVESADGTHANYNHLHANYNHLSFHTQFLHCNH